MKRLEGRPRLWLKTRKYEAGAVGGLTEGVRFAAWEQQKLEVSALRALIVWHREYRAEWDAAPHEYAEHGVVQWGKSRRLGMLRQGRVKVYLGVQHVDPGKPGWAIVDAPTARFFVSVFLSGRVLTLRTYPTMHEALDMVASFLDRASS